MKLNQKGFGVVEGLLAIIAITLIVGVSFYVVNANKDDKKTETTTLNNETPKLNETKQATVQPQKTDEELIIEAPKKTGFINADGSVIPVEQVRVISIIGNNAKGGAGYGPEGGGYAFIAHKTNGIWKIVYTAQELPGKEIGEKYNLPADWYDTSY